MFSTGVFSTGVFSTGVFSTGVFSTGVFCTGVFRTRVFTSSLNSLLWIAKPFFQSVVWSAIFGKLYMPFQSIIHLYVGT